MWAAWICGGSLCLPEDEMPDGTTICNNWREIRRRTVKWNPSTSKLRAVTEHWKTQVHIFARPRYQIWVLTTSLFTHLKLSRAQSKWIRRKQPFPSKNTLEFTQNRAGNEREQIENSRLCLVMLPSLPFIFIRLFNRIANDVPRNSNGGTTYYFERPDLTIWRAHLFED